MKKINYILTIVAVVFCYSCNKFLDVNPDNRTTLDSREAIKELLVSAYPSMQYYSICEVMSDNVIERNFVPNSTRVIFNESMYSWTDNYDVGTGQDTPVYVWNALYSAIAAANQALDAIKNAPNQDQFAAQRGEALVCRAYAHFLLVNIWALHYDPSTAGNLPGVPLNDEPEKQAIKQYIRHSIADVYSTIEKDLVEGIPLINDNEYVVPKYHFTKAAAHAFASRFYLYKGDWDKVIEHANRVLPAANISEKLLDLPNKEFFEAAAADYRIKYRSVEQPNIIMLVSAMSWWGRDHSTTSYVQMGMSTEHSALFSATSVAGYPATYYRRWVNSNLFVNYTYKIYEHFRYTEAGSSTGYGYVMGAHLTMEEVLLNRAEAFAMKGDLTKALSDVDILIGKRVNTGRTAVAGGDPNPPPAPVTLERVKTFYASTTAFPDLDPFYVANIAPDQMFVLKHIVHWRRLEFMQEGLRWFDIKRFNLEVTHKFPISNQPDIVLGKNDLRKALQIPMEAQAFGIEKNPR
ncbi:MAG: RagB/SusD family nutrient uptake outer membrane protein [Prevotellaceae bacterium]|nr:RagB/SusD family nutrient uptake outer membrane protein [Prevotellaceae bacterium]